MNFLTGPLLVAFAFAAVIFVGSLLGATFGALGGWIVGWFFDDTILSIARQLGIDGVPMWQLGAFLGFVGSFFKSHQSCDK